MFQPICAMVVLMDMRIDITDCCAIHALTFTVTSQISAAGSVMP